MTTQTAGIAAIAFWGLYALVEPQTAWRALFWLGVPPALLILYIRRNICDPEAYHATRAQMTKDGDSGNSLEIFSPTLPRTTVFASLLAAGMPGAYYAVTTWLLTFLKTERHLPVLNTSGYLLVVIAALALPDTTGRELTTGNEALGGEA